jgi:ribosomal protein S12 methylthiotransferase accessory factor
MPNLFARAASWLLCDNPEHTGDPQARLLLEALGYADPAGVGISGPETHHRARLLMTASRFVRVFELAAPEAPGLVCFGAEIDPAMADPLHAGSPAVSVSGVGLSLQQAFQGCIGEGVEYLSQLQTGTDVLELPGPNGPAAGQGPATREFLAAFEACRLRPDAELSWHRVTRVTDRCEVLLPADLCLRRPLDQREIRPPFPLSTGSAAGTSWHAAALHGLMEVIERDAVSLWWWGGNRGRSIPPQDEAHGPGSAGTAAAKCFAAAELVARHNDGYRRAQRCGDLLRAGWFWLCFWPGRAADTRGRGLRRSSGNVPGRTGLCGG